jgi:hypothetical protein
MSTVIEICNMALGSVRGQSINSLTETSLQAQLCSLHYENCRDQVLKEADWGFNKTRVPLAALSGVEVFNWSYVWTYPLDCLKINHLIRNIEEYTPATATTPPTRFYYENRQNIDLYPRVEYGLFINSGTRIIATREGELRIDYRAKVTDATLYPPNFVSALSSLLGARLALPLAGVKDGRALRQDCFEMYNSFLAQASDDNANEQQYDQQESEFIVIRN